MRNISVRKTAVGGIAAAIVTVMMFFEGFVTVGQYTVPVICGMIILSVSYVTGKKYALYAYAAASVLTMLFCADKEAVLCFIMYAGYYPVFRSVIEGVKSIALRFIIKILHFDISAFVIYEISISILGIPADEFSVLGISIPIVFFAALNIAFIVYDIMLDRFEKRFRKMIIKSADSIFGKN